MHVLLVRAAILDADPSIALRLVQAWTTAKQECLDRLTRDRLVVTSMWFAALLQEERAATGSLDTYPWGFTATRHEVAKLVDYAVLQGILAVPCLPEELFHPATLDT